MMSNVSSAVVTAGVGRGRGRGRGFGPTFRGFSRSRPGSPAVMERGGSNEQSSSSRGENSEYVSRGGRIRRRKAERKVIVIQGGSVNIKF